MMILYSVSQTVGTRSLKRYKNICIYDHQNSYFRDTYVQCIAETNESQSLMSWVILLAYADYIDSETDKLFYTVG